jgi:LPS export ABC transporter protein LptC
MRIVHYTIFALVLLSSACVNDMQDVQQASDAVKPGTERGKDVEMYYSENGFVKMCIKAPTLTRYQIEDPYVEFNDGLHVDFYNDSMQVISNLSAGYGVRYEKQLKTVVQSNVLVVNEKGEQLATEELTWDEKKHQIYTDQFVTITTDDEILYGNGLTADETMTEYSIINPVGIIKIQMDDAETDENF